jgi:NAD(P)-dependent dehydrogenase (short-subunit alcohol dehydrogenase family)
VDLQLGEKVARASKGIGRHLAGHLAAEGTEAAITACVPVDGTRRKAIMDR